MSSRYNLNNRIVYADLLRIFAAFGVIINHIPSFQSEIASFSWQIDNIFYSIVRFDVPVFIMISGMFNLRSDNSNNSEYGKFFKKSLQNCCGVGILERFVYVPIAFMQNYS